MIIVGKLRVHLTGTFTGPGGFENARLNQKVQEILVRVDKEREQIEAIEDQLIVHAQVARHVDSMAEADAQFDLALAGQTPEDYLKFEGIKRRFWNEYSRAKTKLRLFEGENKELVGKIRGFLDRRAKDFNEKLVNS